MIDLVYTAETKVIVDLQEDIEAAAFESSECEEGMDQEAKARHLPKQSTNPTRVLCLSVYKHTSLFVFCLRLPHYLL